MVREKPVQTADVEMEWQVAPGDSGRPSLVSIAPGGTITYEHRNLGGKAATVAASINTKNFLAPATISRFCPHSQPYLYELDDANVLALLQPCSTLANSVVSSPLVLLVRKFLPYLWTVQALKCPSLSSIAVHLVVL